MTQITLSDPAAAGYNCLAPYYDRFTAGWQYERWIAAIEARAMALGLSGRRVLDLACGTGNSTGPLLNRGYLVTACDISDGMIDQARRNYPAHAAAFLVADMRELPELGEFDLVLCLDDAINYLLSDQDLHVAFSCVARSLAPGGIFAFDVNSLMTYRTCFAEDSVTESQGIMFVWRGEGLPGAAPGEQAAASVDIFTERGDGLWERRSMRHLQRHHPRHAVQAGLGSAGLCHRATLGQHRGARLEPSPDEERHTKLVYFATRSDTEEVRNVDRGALKERV
jgi:SAM-dependent methyltransferase